MYDMYSRKKEIYSVLTHRQYFVYIQSIYKLKDYLFESTVQNTYKYIENMLRKSTCN